MRSLVLKLMLALTPLAWSTHCHAFSFRNAPVLAVSIPIFSLAAAVFFTASRKAPEVKTQASLDLAKKVFEHDLLVTRSTLVSEGSSEAFSAQ